jgi:uncharacterized RDD family membrane protein YckC
MQCPSCRAVYSNGLSKCPRCKTPASKPAIESETKTVVTAETEAQDSIKAAVPVATDDASVMTAPATSTLIEFPGVSRVSRPQWRKELSERVREIQERRARESVREPGEVTLRQVGHPAVAETTVPSLGLVPQPDAPVVNPIVAAALKRLERARQPLPPVQRSRAGRGGAATAAAARIADEQYETEATPVKAQPTAATAPVAVPMQSAQAEALPQSKAPEPPRERPLVVVPAPSTTKVVAPAALAPAAVVPASKPKPAKVKTEKIEEPAPETVDEEKTGEAALEDFYDDRAPVFKRVAGSLIDMLVVAFASSPFAAIIELTNGNWSDWRVMASMGGIVLIVLFLYLTAATALAGRTWGMSLFSLRAVDAETGMPPTTKQAVGRAILYMLSLLTVGLGILYALFDVEGRTAHDHLSGTVVVRD